MSTLLQWLAERKARWSAREVTHLSNEQIIMNLDGEGSQRDRLRIRRHLEACWNCRFRSEEISNTIHCAVKFRTLLMGERFRSVPPAGRSMLAARLGQQRMLFVAPSFAPKVFSRGVGRSSSIFAVILSTTAIALFLALHSVKPTNLRQPTLMERALAMEQGNRPSPTQVLHRKLVIERRDIATQGVLQTQNIESWTSGSKQNAMIVRSKTGALLGGAWTNSAGHTQYLGKQEHDLLSPDLRTVLDASLDQANTTLDNDLLSVAAFAKLPQHGTSSSDNPIPSKSLDGQTQSLTFRSDIPRPYDDHRPRILLAKLDLRTADLRPVLETLQIVSDQDEQSEFTIRAVSEEKLWLSEVSPAIFFPPVARPNLPSPATITSPHSYHNADAGIELLEILDGAGSLLKQDLQVSHAPSGEFLISGVVPDDIRRQAILQLVRRSEAQSNIETRILTFAETQDKGGKRQYKSIEVTGESVADGSPLLKTYFSETLHLSSESAIEHQTTFSNELIRLAMDVQAQAAAINEIRSLVSENDAANASPNQRRAWWTLLHQHASSLRDSAEQMQKLVSPLARKLCAGCVYPPLLSFQIGSLLPTSNLVLDQVSLSVAGGAGQTTLPIASTHFQETLAALVQLANSLSKESTNMINKPSA